MARYINPYTDFGFKFRSEAEVSQMTTAQRDEYERSRLSYLEVKEAVNTAEREGRKKVAQEMKKAGEPMSKIRLYTGLSEEEIEGL
ncbi:MAG: hypothetical protein SF052_22280 [Bacteroidia bacterium]|nr:hypothetical protein [Bacteroidia bacterium]